MALEASSSTGGIWFSVAMCEGMAGEACAGTTSSCTLRSKIRDEAGDVTRGEAAWSRPGEFGKYFGEAARGGGILDGEPDRSIAGDCVGTPSGAGILAFSSFFSLRPSECIFSVTGVPSRSAVFSLRLADPGAGVLVEMLPANASPSTGLAPPDVVGSLVFIASTDRVPVQGGGAVARIENPSKNGV